MSQPSNPLAAVRRTGVVQSYGTGDGTVDVALGGDTTTTVNADYMASYVPMIGDTVVVLSAGADHFIIGAPAWNYADTPGSGVRAPSAAMKWTAYQQGVVTSMTSTAYTNVFTALSIVKHVDRTDLLVTIMGSSFCVTTAAFAFKYGVNINATDYDVGQFYFNQVSIHAAWGSAQRVSGVPAGPQTVQPRWKNTIAARDTRADAQDQWTMIVEELPTQV